MAIDELSYNVHTIHTISNNLLSTETKQARPFNTLSKNLKLWTG